MIHLTKFIKSLGLVEVKPCQTEYKNMSDSLKTNAI